MQPTRFFRDTAGHSLIELVTVLVLITVIVSLAAPSMGAYMGRFRTQRALDRVVGDLAYARILAVRSGARVVFQLQGGSSYTVQVQSTPPRTAQSVSIAKDFPGVVVTSSVANSRFEFDSRGLLVNVGAGTIVATRGAVVDSLVLTAAGRVYRAY